MPTSSSRPAVLDRGRRALVALSAALGTREPDRIQAALREAAAEALPGEVEEVLLQSHLFVGYPDALNALAQWRALVTPPPSPSPEEPAQWARRGARVCETVYGSSYGALRRNVAALHPDVDRWMVELGYGRVLARPGLALATRELCVVALLVVWNAPRQLHSHLRGAINAGAAAADVDAAVALACGLLPQERAASARSLWEHVRAALQGTTDLNRAR